MRAPRCKCDLPAGTCADINCPHSLSSLDNSKFWIEGWACSKYSAKAYVKTPIGNLVKKVKYERDPSYTELERTQDAKKISSKVIEMIKWLYDSKNLPFDICLSPPSHQNKPLDLAQYIAKSISGGSVKYAEKVLVERMELTAVKNMTKYERSIQLLDNFVFDCPEEFYPKKGFLVVDDVFETGSTLKGICRAINQVFPGMPRYVITATYIGQMGKIQAL